ncbi:MAG TPA: hypothetical protein ENH62_05795 [Marinobacter sp.]|uniref:Uncharacterized protein n=1 Tax=marine sediment metagenome TaxID=412755 RepID=A0A0F9TMF1_9ZZZZ|nr:hypothetical protein [Marinobacter sp.]
MAIRPRLDNWYHSYAHVFEDLRSGRLVYAEYDIMVQEDAIEMARRILDETIESLEATDSVDRPGWQWRGGSTDLVPTFVPLCAPSTGPFLEREDVPS